MGFFSRKVQVTLIDDRSGEVIAKTNLEPSALPASFFESTTMHLGEADWSVVAADPMTRELYEKSQRLVLRLRPVERVNPQRLLFSLPTICDQLPVSDGPDADGAEVVLLEDDWRQVELVSSSLLERVQTEIDAVRTILMLEREGPGFRNVHVRASLPPPLAGTPVSLDALSAVIGDPPCLPLRFDGAARRVTDGFALRVDARHVLYGIHQRGNVTILGLHPCRPGGVAGLEPFAGSYGLVVVNWCRALVGAPGDASFKAAFTALDG
jgi:hypothetical protein